ncbi:PLP-dependent aminotransferase family protein [Streptomyces sp. MI02-7b]|uniref:aminotransferase-like domain-containing protein n=1 Tax=Streptomyces sp. MI02-7b TaxID=462941 RepID=UPI0029A5008E|nr:PLP-dependent aminotransferase family protein [Streptomyces sp. MI02-7b]MDX3078419.1 PLP-dependent aminotransferase family protein [Streptomyces sp. MI02-7b]
MHSGFDHKGYEDLLAARTRRGNSDAIRDILDAAGAKGVLSLAGGIPAAESFPVRRIAEATDRVMSRSATAALQYAPTEGVGAMREVLAWRASETGASATPDRVLVTSGSQQGLDMVAQVLLESDDVVALDDPSYLGALQVFRRAGARLLPVPSDRDGLRTDILAERLRSGSPCKVVYVVPHYHNPTGAVLAADRRRHLAELANRYGFVIVEDDPYADLGFVGERLPSIDVHSDRVIRLMSLSKSLCPGFRTAGLVAPSTLIGELTAAKQCSDLQTNTWGQYVLAELLSDEGFLPQHLQQLRELYSAKSEKFSSLVRDILPGLDFEMPLGGLFLWATIVDPRVNSSDLYRAALAEGVAVVPGDPFCAEHDGSRHLRISYSALDEIQSKEALTRLETAYEVVLGIR